MRILSLQPASPEMAYALGLGPSIVGVSHECTYPPAARRNPVVSTSIIDPDRMTSAEIDAAVAQAGRTGESLYRIDRALAKDLTLCRPGVDVATREVLHLRGRSEHLLVVNLRRTGELARARESADVVLGLGMPTQRSLCGHGQNPDSGL